MKKASEIPQPPLIDDLKKFNSELSLSQLTDISILKQEISALKADNEHNKTHIKSIAQLGIAFFVSVCIAAVTMYFKIQDQIIISADKADVRLLRTEDKLESELNKVKDDFRQLSASRHEARYGYSEDTEAVMNPREQKSQSQMPQEKPATMRKSK